MECNAQTTDVSTEVSGKPEARDPISEKSGCTEKIHLGQNRANDFIRAAAELKSLQESINTSDNGDAYDVFGRSVTMQLKKLSEELALLAQCRIQNILTEVGIEEFRRNHSTSTSYINPASVVSL
jgi:hypothetical protein